MLEQGPVEATILRQCMMEGLEIPEKIANAPLLLPGLEVYWTAFMNLLSSRQIGLTASPIPWNIIQEYCDHQNLSEEQSEAMHYHIAMMDTAFLEHQQKKAPKSGKHKG